MNTYVCTCDLCYVNSATDRVFDKQRVSTLTCSVLLYRQEYSNPDHLPLRTTALTPADGDIRERAHKLCCEYLRGAWKRATAQDFVIRKVRYVCVRRMLSRTYFPQEQKLHKTVSKLHQYTRGTQEGWFYFRLKEVVCLHTMKAYRGSRGIAPVISGFLSPRHGASSGCRWRNGFQMWRVAANTLTKQPRTADKGWSFSLGVERGAANNSSP
jgi:hypothetical protein